MAMDGLRGYLQLASGLADMSRARATEAASALLSLSAGLTGGRSGSSVQVQVQELAEELLAAAAANRRSLIALVRSEVERALERSPIPSDELDRARAAIAKLSADVEDLRTQVLGNPAVGEVASRLGLAGSTPSRPVGSDVAPTGSYRADLGVVVDAAFTDRVDETVEAPPRRRPPRRQIAGRAATSPVPGSAAGGGVTVTEPRTGTGSTVTPARTGAASTPLTGRATGKAAAKKTAAKKAATTTATKAAPATGAVTTKRATKKAATKRTPAEKASATSSTARKAATKNTSARKTGTTRATTKTTPAKKTGTTRATTKTTPAKKAGTKKTGTTRATTKTTPAKKTGTAKRAATKSSATKSTAAKAAPRAGGGA